MGKKCLAFVTLARMRQTSSLRWGCTRRDKKICKHLASLGICEAQLQWKMPQNSKIPPLCAIIHDTYGEYKVNSSLKTLCCHCRAPQAPQNGGDGINTHLSSRMEMAATPQAPRWNLSLAVAGWCSPQGCDAPSPRPLSPSPILSFLPLYQSPWLCKSRSRCGWEPSLGAVWSRGPCQHEKQGIGLILY